MYQSTTRMEMSACKLHPQFPEIQEIIDEWTQIMFGCCEWRFLRARNNPSHMFSGL
jgi:hypothetical protein